MELLILGKPRKGKKSFELNSYDEFGYNLECIDGGGVINFNNIQKIEWLNKGEHVYLTPSPMPDNKYNLARFDKVVIKKTNKIEKQNFISRCSEPDVVKNMGNLHENRDIMAFVKGEVLDIEFSSFTGSTGLICQIEVPSGNIYQALIQITEDEDNFIDETSGKEFIINDEWDLKVLTTK